MKPNGKPVDSVAPGYTQPPGDVNQMPAGEMVNRWRGEKMDLDPAVEVMFQQARHKPDVPAGTPVG